MPTANGNINALVIDFANEPALLEHMGADPVGCVPRALTRCRDGDFLLSQARRHQEFYRGHQCKATMTLQIVVTERLKARSSLVQQRPLSPVQCCHWLK